MQLRASSRQLKPDIVTIVAIPVFCGLLLVFWLTGSRKLTGDVLVLITIAVIVLTAWRDGGLSARTIFWFPCVPLIANFLAGKIRSFWSTLICWVALLSMYIAHDRGLLIGYEGVDSLAGRLSAAMASVFFVAIISYLYEESHKRAEEERAVLGRSKNNWVSMVSHELRTPLTAIYGSLGLIMEVDKKLDGNTMEMMGIAYSNCQRLVRLVNDVLDVEKIESGELKLNKADTDLLALVREVELTNRDIAKKRGISIDVYSDQNELHLQVDADRIVQALQNLVSNAIKFSPDNTTVKIQVGRHEKEAQISVSDRGPGITPEFEDKIFTRFAQADHIDTRGYDGSGLGLSISKSIIEQHGGIIGFRNNASKGATFYFMLPYD